MTYLKETLVIDTKTVRCGRCYKLKQDGKIDWMGFDQRKTVSICDVGSGNCQIVPSKDVEDVIVTKVKNSSISFSFKS